MDANFNNSAPAPPDSDVGTRATGILRTTIPIVSTLRIACSAFNIPCPPARVNPADNPGRTFVTHSENVTTEISRVDDGSGFAAVAGDHDGMAAPPPQAAPPPAAGTAAAPPPQAASPPAAGSVAASTARVDRHGNSSSSEEESETPEMNAEQEIAVRKRTPTATNLVPSLRKTSFAVDKKNESIATSTQYASDRLREKLKSLAILPTMIDHIIKNAHDLASTHNVVEQSVTPCCYNLQFSSEYF